MTAMYDLTKHAETVQAANRHLVSHAACACIKEYGPKVALEMVRSLSDSNRDDAGLWDFWMSVENEIESLMNAFFEGEGRTA